MENAQDKGSNPCSAIVCAIEKPTTKEGIRPAHLTVGKVTQRAHSSSVGSSQCMRVCGGGKRERGGETDRQTDRQRMCRCFREEVGSSLPFVLL